MAVAVLTRRVCPTRDPSPRKPRGPSMASTASFPTADTTVTFKQVPGENRYILRKRRTDANQWELPSGTTACQLLNIDKPSPTEWTHKCTLKGIRVDDWVFGVSSVSKDGFESPVASAVPGGAFKPYVAPPPAAPK